MTIERRELDYLKQAAIILKRCANGATLFTKLIDDATSNVENLQSSIETDFSKWIRDQPELDSKVHSLSIHNIDWVVHQFKTAEDKNGTRELNNLMIIEEKRFGAGPSFAQRDTFRVLDQMLQKTLNVKQQSRQAARAWVWNERGERVLVRYYGFHVLQFSHSGPDDSEMIKWNSKIIDKEKLMKLLRFELNPKTLARRDITERRHHRNREREEPLFDGLN